MFSRSNRHRIGTVAGVLILSAALGAQTQQKPYEPSSGRGARMRSGCRRGQPWSRRCSTTPRSRRRTSSSISAPATAAPSLRRPNAALAGSASNTTPISSSSRGGRRRRPASATRPPSRRATCTRLTSRRRRCWRCSCCRANIEKLVPKFLELPPGTRIVANTFWVPDWTPDDTQTLTEGCENWCTSHLFIVPAKVGGPMARRRRRGDADAEVPDDRGHLHARDRSVRAGEGADARQRHHRFARANRVPGHRQREHDGGRRQVGGSAARSGSSRRGFSRGSGKPGSLRVPYPFSLAGIL